MRELDQTHYDAVVLGTGLVESIVAAALACAGKSVLHLDVNDYYGASWASFNYTSLLAWVQQHQSLPTPQGTTLTALKPNARYYNRMRYKDVKATEYTWPTCPDLAQALARDGRRFSLELAPKLIASNGSLVELLITSDIGKYLEFRLLASIFLFVDHLEQVPSSKEAIFSSTTLSLVEKRKLMKFLMFAGNCTDEQLDELQDAANKPYAEYLCEQFGLTSHLASAIEYAVTFKPPLEMNVSTRQGIIYTRNYLRSFGRFGPSSFLCTAYGSNEILQAFCRVCAVFGGTYILDCDVVEFEQSNDEKRVTALKLDDGQRITFEHLITSADYLPTPWQSNIIKQQSILRWLIILDGPLSNDETKTAMIVFAPNSSVGNTEPVTFLQLDAETNACPVGYWVVYAWTRANEDGHKAMKACARTLFQTPDDHLEDNTEKGEQSSKPRALFSLQYEEQIRSAKTSHQSTLPTGVYVCDDPDAKLDVDDALQQARNIFEKIVPNAPFLPKPKSENDLEDI